MSSQSVTHSSQIENIRLEQGILQAREDDVRERNGRYYRPFSFDDNAGSIIFGGILGCTCTITLICGVAGAAMWGSCSNPNDRDCNEAILKAGQALIYTSAASLGLCISSILCFNLCDYCSRL